MTPFAWLTEVQERAAKATEGPWAAWLDQDGQPHMNHMLMVGNADAVIPEGESWVENVDVNPVAHIYTPEDRDFLVHARTEHPAMSAALNDVLDIHVMEACPDCGAGPSTICECGPADCQGCTEMWPCPTVRAITEHLTKEDNSGE